MNAPPTPPLHPSLEAVRARMISDLLAGERRQTEAALNVVQAMREVLFSLAQRLASEQVQELRRKDQGIFLSWSPADWQSFFEAVFKANPWRAAGSQPPDAGLLIEIQELQAAVEHWRGRAQTSEQQLGDARRQLARLEAASQKAPAARSEAPVAARLALSPEPEDPSAGEDGLTRKETWRLPAAGLGPYARILADLEQARSLRRPARFEKRLSDDDRRWRRQAAALLVVGRGGLAPKPEIELLLCHFERLGPRGSSLGKPLDLLIGQSLLICENLGINGELKSNLFVLRLSQEGRELYRLLLGSDPVENEWERILRLHEGARFPAHTFGLLAFAMHARLRGWDAQVAPQVAGPAQPDVLIERGEERHYVEIELGDKEKPAKWRNQAALQGYVALLARTAAQREQLAGDCKQMKLPGLAGDLESLIVGQRLYEIGPHTPLWRETWAAG